MDMVRAGGPRPDPALDGPFLFDICGGAKSVNPRPGMKNEKKLRLYSSDEGT
jgi:hypothetical protein